MAKCVRSTQELRHRKQNSSNLALAWLPVDGNERQKSREEEDRSLPVDLPPTPAPPALNKKKSSILLNQHNQIEGVSNSALAENPLRAADRVSTLIKSWDGLVEQRHPTRSQSALIYRGLKKLPRLVSTLCVWMCEQREVFIVCGRAVSLNIMLLYDQCHLSSSEISRW